MPVYPALGLGLVLVIAAATDLARHRVYNWLTFPAMILALALHAAISGWSGLGLSCLGLLAGGLIFFPVFFLGGMGAGDVKLMAVVGAFMGWRFAIQTALYAAVFGGIAALVIITLRGELWTSLKSIGRFLRSLVIPRLAVEPLSRRHPLPYAVMIAAGAAAALWLPPLLAL